MPSTEIMIEPNGLKIKTFSELTEDLFESKPPLPSFPSFTFPSFAMYALRTLYFLLERNLYVFVIHYRTRKFFIVVSELAVH